MNTALPPTANRTTNMEIDALSGKTLHPDNPWVEVIRKKSKSPAATTTKQTAPTTQEPASRPAVSLKPRQQRSPRLPPGNYTVVYRPRAGLSVAKVTTHELTVALAGKCEIPLARFYNLVTLVLQATPNVIVASTADPELAITLSNIDTLQVLHAVYEFSTYMKPPPDTCRGVIHGLEAPVTASNLLEFLQANKPLLLHARMMGQTRSALLTFQGKHVPFYVKVGSMLYRCRPFRRTTQVCRLCGELGHRMDVCPQPENTRCPDCGQTDPNTEHVCNPTCQLCSQPHATAGKDCPRRFIPTTPAGARTASSTANNKQVSWSAVAARSLAAQTPPQQTVIQTPPPPNTVSPQIRAAQTPALQSTTHTSPPPIAPSPEIPALMALIQNLQQQNAQLIARLEALEASRAATPPSSIPTPSPMQDQVEAAVEAQFTAKVIPYVAQQVEQSSLQMSKLITDTAEQIVKLLTERISALEQAIVPDLPQAKRIRTPHDPPPPQ